MEKNPRCLLQALDSLLTHHPGPCLGHQCRLGSVGNGERALERLQEPKQAEAVVSPGTEWGQNENQQLRLGRWVTVFHSLIPSSQAATSPCPGRARLASWPGLLQRPCSWPPASGGQPCRAPECSPNRRIGPRHPSHLKPIPQRELATLETYVASRAPHLCTGCPLE